MSFCQHTTSIVTTSTLPRFPPNYPHSRGVTTPSTGRPSELGNQGIRESKTKKKLIYGLSTILTTPLVDREFFVASDTTRQTESLTGLPSIRKNDVFAAFPVVGPHDSWGEGVR